MVDITIVNGVYKPTYNWGAPSHVCWFIPLAFHRIEPLDFQVVVNPRVLWLNFHRHRGSAKRRKVTAGRAFCEISE